MGFIVVDKEDLAEISEEDRNAEYEKIIKQLEEQIKSASDNAANYKKMGDVKNAFL